MTGGTVKPEEISARLTNPEYVAKIITRGNPEVPLPDDPDEKARCVAAREIVRLYSQIKRPVPRTITEVRVHAELGRCLREYVTSFGDEP